MKYAWRPGCRIKGDAEVVGQELLRVADVYGGLSAQIVLAEAKKKKSPIHDLFDWDDQVAAKRWRLRQAGHLVRAIVIVPEEGESFPSVRLFVTVGDEDEAQPKIYADVRVALADDAVRPGVLARAKAEYVRLRQKHDGLKAFAEIHAAIDRLAAG